MRATPPPLLHRGLAQSGSSSAKRGFSNDWKNLPAVSQRLENFFGGELWEQKDKRATKEEEAGMSDNYDYF
jgi:hypothetical protein